MDNNDAKLWPGSPSELGLFIKLYRENRGWTQSTLAELSRLTERTIQRVENGEPSSVVTRRALARAFEIEDLDIFNKKHSLKTADQLKKEAEETEKNYVTVYVTLAKSGKDLADFAEQVQIFDLQQPDHVPQKVAESIATIYDYLRDYGDVDDCYSFSQKLGVHAELDGYLSEVNRGGYSICCALNLAKIVGRNRTDLTPLAMTVGYAFVAQKGKEPKLARVPRALLRRS
jgi:transcriptional regulator with XRE-family HTH domain